MTSAALHVCPARAVPPPRLTTGTPKPPAGRYRRLYRRIGARQHDADRDQPVVGAVGGVQRPALRIEAHLAVDGCRQFGLEGLDVEGRDELFRRFLLDLLFGALEHMVFLCFQFKS